jgi:hypothetical protein
MIILQKVINIELITVAKKKVTNKIDAMFTWQIKTQLGVILIHHVP